MALPPKKDHRISLADAAALTKGHRAAAAANEAKAHYFSRDAFDAMLAQPGCAGIRIYHGRGTDGAKQMVLVGVDGQGADMTSGAIMEQGLPCPPWCDTQSALQG